MSREKGPPVRKLLTLGAGSLLLFVLVTQLTNQPQIGLVAAVLVHMAGLFIVKPWKTK